MVFLIEITPAKNMRVTPVSNAVIKIKLLGE
jgi:hypothetical protein